jgi:hypothetical protein
MAQYKHDRFFKSYLESLYRSKGVTHKNIQVRKDEDLEIDFMFLAESKKSGWQEEKLGLFDRLMQEHPTIIVEHYSGYLNSDRINTCITRKNLYWQPIEKDLTEAARKNLSKSERLSQESQQEIQTQEPFTWILAVNCSEETKEAWSAKPELQLGQGVYKFSPGLRIGIVVITELENSAETLWLRILGNQENAVEAYQAIKKLSPTRREKNDIMEVCKKYCVYLKGISEEEWTEEDKDFMAILTIDEVYDRWVEQTKAEGKAEIARLLINSKYGVNANTQLSNRIKELKPEQLDGLILTISNSQQLKEVTDWLDNSDSRAAINESSESEITLEEAFRRGTKTSDRSQSQSRTKGIEPSL